MALASILAFWTQCDPLRMDGLFRRSGLMRDKWDTSRGASTYGAQTIEKAIRGTSEV
jgi:putative DNA primase/helicase